MPTGSETASGYFWFVDGTKSHKTTVKVCSEFEPKCLVAAELK